MKVLGLFTDGYGGSGGMAQFNKDFLDALSKGSTIKKIDSLALCGEQSYEEIPNNISWNIVDNKMKYVLQCFKLALFNKYNLIICGHINLIILASILKLKLRSKLWTLTHGIEVWEAPGPIKKRCFNGSDLVTTVSRYSRKMILNWSHLDNHRVKILPNTIDLNFFKPGKRPDYLENKYRLKGKKIMLTVGRLSKRERYKGHEQIIRALPKILRKMSDVRYLIVGDGDYISTLKNIAKSIGVDKQVIFAGKVLSKEKVDYYNLADVFVMPSTGEGFGIVFLEALACNTPVVGGNKDGSVDPLSGGKLGILVDPDNEELLIKAIIKQLKDGKKDNRAELKRFSIENFQEQTLKLHRELFKDNLLQLESLEKKSIEFYSSEDDQRFGRQDMETEKKFFQDTLNKFVKNNDGEAAIELGCGKGAFKNIERDYIGLDISFYALKKYFHQEKVLQADMEYLPFKNESSSLIYSFAALEHIPRPERCLEEIDRVLRPEGIVILAPAWFCRPWAAKGLPIKKYKELSWPDKVRKLSIPIRNHIIYRGLINIPKRIILEVYFRIFRCPIEFKYKRLKPNLKEYIYTDSDASTSMDPHRAIFYFLSRKYQVLSCNGFFERLMYKNKPVVVKKKK